MADAAAVGHPRPPGRHRSKIPLGAIREALPQLCWRYGLRRQGLKEGAGVPRWRNRAIYVMALRLGRRSHHKLITPAPFVPRLGICAQGPQVAARFRLPSEIANGAVHHPARARRSASRDACSSTSPVLHVAAPATWSPMMKSRTAGSASRALSAARHLAGWRLASRRRPRVTRAAAPSSPSLASSSTRLVRPAASLESSLRSDRPPRRRQVEHPRCRSHLVDGQRCRLPRTSCVLRCATGLVPRRGASTSSFVNCSRPARSVSIHHRLPLAAPPPPASRAGPRRRCRRPCAA